MSIEKLRKKLKHKRTRGLIRYDYYEQKQRALDLGISTPEGLQWFNCVNGWCTKAVDGLADRLQFDTFENDNFYFAELFNQNNPDIFFDDAILSALITSCSFVYISRGEEDRIRFQIIDGTNATGTLDDFTKLLVEGYAVLDRDDNGNVVTEAYFTPGKTEVYSIVEKRMELIATEEF